MPGRIQRLLRSWGGRLSQALGRGRPAEGEPVEPEPVGQGAERGAAAGEAQGGFARQISQGVRLGVVRRDTQRLRNVSVSRPAPLASRFTRRAMRSASTTPLPFVDWRAGPAPAGQEDPTARAQRGGEGEAGVEAGRDAAWEALWALRGTRRSPPAGGTAEPAPGLPSGEPPFGEADAAVPRGEDQGSAAAAETPEAGTGAGTGPTSLGPGAPTSGPAAPQPAVQKIPTAAPQPAAEIQPALARQPEVERRTEPPVPSPPTLAPLKEEPRAPVPPTPAPLTPALPDVDRGTPSLPPARGEAGEPLSGGQGRPVPPAGPAPGEQRPSTPSPSPPAGGRARPVRRRRGRVVEFSPAGEGAPGEQPGPALPALPSVEGEGAKVAGDVPPGLSPEAPFTGQPEPPRRASGEGVRENVPSEPLASPGIVPPGTAEAPERTAPDQDIQKRPEPRQGAAPPVPGAQAHEPLVLEGQAREPRAPEPPSAPGELEVHLPVGTPASTPSVQRAAGVPGPPPGGGSRAGSEEAGGKGATPAAGGTFQKSLQKVLPLRRLLGRRPAAPAASGQPARGPEAAEPAPPAVHGGEGPGDVPPRPLQVGSPGECEVPGQPARGPAARPGGMPTESPTTPDTPSGAARGAGSLAQATIARHRPLPAASWIGVARAPMPLAGRGVAQRREEAGGTAPPGAAAPEEQAAGPGHPLAGTLPAAASAGEMPGEAVPAAGRGERPPGKGPPAAPQRDSPIAAQRAAGAAPELRGLSQPEQIQAQVIQPRLVPFVVQAAAADAPEQGAAAAPPAREEERQAPEQDLESVAQEVYRVIRRRLAVEREREQGRL